MFLLDFDMGHWLSGRKGEPCLPIDSARDPISSLAGDMTTKSSMSTGSRPQAFSECVASDLSHPPPQRK